MEKRKNKWKTVSYYLRHPITPIIELVLR